MKRTFTTLALVLLISAPGMALADSTIVTLNASSTVSTDYIMLGNIATIVPSPMTNKNSAKIAATIVGRSTLPGLSRPLTRGDVRLKLRANGIDPATVDIEGPTDITVTSNANGQTGGTASNWTGQSSNTGSGAQTVPNPKVIKFGDTLDILVIDGPVIIHAQGFANQTGAVGDSIQVRRDGINHLLTCTVIGAGQVQLEE